MEILRVQEAPADDRKNLKEEKFDGMEDAEKAEEAQIDAEEDPKKTETVFIQPQFRIWSRHVFPNFG